MNICKECGKEFKGQKNQVYCCLICQRKVYEIQREFKDLSTGTVGAIQELRVSVDLLSKGFEVFRSLSPACSCDLFARKDGKEYEIEVRTAYRLKNGKISHPSQNIRAKYLALVANGEIIYRPKIV